MNFTEEFNKLNYSEKNEFQNSCNTLLLKGFIVRDYFDIREKSMRTSKEYRFIDKYYELVDEYLSFSGWHIEKDVILGVISLINLSGDNRIKLDRETSLTIFALRLIYEKEKDQSASTSEAIYVTTPLLVRYMLEHGIVLPNKRLTARNLAKSLRFLVNHNVINKVSGNFDEGNVSFYILPSIVYCLDNDRIRAISDALSDINQNDKEEDSLKEIKEDEVID